ncbi:TusE/DsrC/DsvC family sulfur relay protein [Actinobacillus equuli subsp. equuli]|uniref:Sulfurtransferase n=2 Tax=Actinobacillus equuli TaxID=718 RepID=A0A0A7MF84_ACTEU|nr:TusE/DsrC/DsvC family sulfur relay protein [Actinobacillus equuli]AIZ78437.1 sulfur transfer protein TusE [Actinobacillus equuli subsp. equuli]MDE8035613.1 TusE/DsrC/DsvC family sulfur relay protein [Actinobacillus equuli subsp. equuli]MDG4949055.1 TusE/DsrC/DsvC family sulfur relay protein [Actinobacillus equuli subsp. haemolyticus]MDG4951856.1 TusE/DsrC/DsvC family sulfur relay protein [Actinobacillus equuli subsp. equuli]WGE42511.1 TusE/DsrC/DsvC family sulfur relay protein [Actinobacill
MYYIELNEQKYPTDASGYLTNLDDWSEALAIEIAKKEQIVLTNEHWEIIFLVRDFYQEYKTSPAIRMLVKAMAQKFGEEKGNSRYLQRLFPDGPAKQATKIAGLPKPIKCL